MDKHPSDHSAALSTEELLKASFLRRGEQGEIQQQWQDEPDPDLVQSWVDQFSPLLQADLPEVPGNLDPLSNEKLNHLTLDVEQRITRFAEFYPSLDRAQSQIMREQLDAHLHSLRTERASRQLPPLPVLVPAGPPTTGADAAKAEQPKPVDATPAAIPMSRTIEQGKFCEQVIDDIKKIKNLCLGTGRSVAEIQNEHPEWAVWKLRESLSSEDQDTFNHPRQWEAPVGYARLILSKVQGVSTHTIKSWTKAYRRSLRTK